MKALAVTFELMARMALYVTVLALTLRSLREERRQRKTVARPAR